MKRFIGDIDFIKLDINRSVELGGSNGKIIRGILNENIFKLDYKVPHNGANGEIRLRSKDSFKFEGSARDLKSKISAIMNVNFYSNEQNAILIGYLQEGKSEMYCIITLEEVKEFKE